MIGSEWLFRIGSLPVGLSTRASADTLKTLLGQNVSTTCVSYVRDGLAESIMAAQSLSFRNLAREVLESLGLVKEKSAEKKEKTVDASEAEELQIIG